MAPVSFGAGVMSVDEEQPDFPNLPGGQLPNLEDLPNHQPEVPIETPLPEYDGDRCPANKWNFEGVPQPSSGAFCSQYSCNSCCDDDKLIDTYLTKGIITNSDGTMNKYGPYHFEGCNSKGKKVTDNSGTIGSACNDFIKTAHCVKSCDPNAYIYYDGDRDINHGATGIPTCDGFCRDFLSTCGDEHLCYNKNKMAEVLTDLIVGDGFDETKDYDAFKCVGDYTCEKLGDTVLAGNGALYENTGALKDKLDELKNKYPGKEDYEHFCQRFTFGLYSSQDSDLPCIDPRNPQEFADSVIKQQTHWNQKNPDDKKAFQVTETCPTGLSTGAIVGITVGCLAGVVLIGVIVYFVAFRKAGDESQQDEYTAGSFKQKSTSSDSTAVPMMEQEGSIVKESANADYDPRESQRQ